MDYKLATELVGHEGDVRSLCVLSGGITRLVSGSRDRFVKVWSGDTSGRSFEATTTVFAHEHWVSALVALPDGGGFATGCQDQKIRVFDGDGKLKRTLEGHNGPVTSLALAANGELISGSWDGTAKSWDLASGSCTVTYPGHENGSCVLGLPNGDVVTGSAGESVGGQHVGFQLRLWRNGHQIRSCKQHQNSVRALALLREGIGFASVSNDGTARMWSIEGEELQCMSNPSVGNEAPSFCFDVEPLADGGLATACDDCCVRVWQNGSCIQQLGHPCTVWCVVALPNGDIATGAADGVVRVFTRDETRAAPLEVQTYYATQVDEAVKARARKTNTKASTDPTKFPKLFDAQPGTGEGEVKVFNKDGVATVFQWMGSTWVEVGEMIGSADQETGDDGQTYDKVIPVELEDPSSGGIRRLKLGFNNGDNPWSVAQKFVERNGLGEEHIEQIAQFVQQNRGVQSAPTIGMAGGGGGGSSSGGGPVAMDVEPPSSAAAAQQQYTHFPLRTATGLAFEKGNLNAALAKLSAPGAEGEAGGALEEADLRALGELVRTLQQTSRYHSSEITPAQLASQAACIHMRALDLRAFLCKSISASHTQPRTSVRSALISANTYTAGCAPQALAELGGPRGVPRTRHCARHARAPQRRRAARRRHWRRDHSPRRIQRRPGRGTVAGGAARSAYGRFRVQGRGILGTRSARSVARGGARPFVVNAEGWSPMR